MKILTNIAEAVKGDPRLTLINMGENSLTIKPREYIPYQYARKLIEEQGARVAWIHPTRNGSYFLKAHQGGKKIYVKFEQYLSLT